MIVLATTNPGKIEELRLLSPPEFIIRSLDDVHLEPAAETGSTFLENARIKAKSIARHGYIAIADDSGLEVDALDGRPGVLSARFAGAHASDDDNNEKLLRCLDGRSPSRHTARFRSVVVFATPDGVELFAEGKIAGRITSEPRGGYGFGYDPIFEIEDAHAPELAGKTMAELEPHVKNRYSHRGRAYRALLRQLHDRPDLMRQIQSSNDVVRHTNEES